jgi:hypothetical protein
MKFHLSTELKSKVMFSGMQTLSSTVRGGLNIYLISILGFIASGEVVSDFAIYVFIATFSTQFSGEILIRGFGKEKVESRYEFYFYALISDFTLFVLCGIYIIYYYASGSSIDSLTVTFFFYLLTMCFSQIIFNVFLKIKAWKWLSLAAILDTSFLLFLGVVILFEPTKEVFVLLAISKPISLLICGVSFSLRSCKFHKLMGNFFSHGGVFVRSVSMTGFFRVFTLLHIINLLTKTALSTLDVVLVQIVTNSEQVGVYRLVKTMAGIPSIIFGPIWTSNRDRIQNDQLNSTSIFDRSRSIVQVASIGTLSLLIVLPFAYYVASMLPESFLVASIFLKVDSLYAFSCWYLQSSMFGWARYYNLYSNYLWSATIQNMYIIIAAILLSFLISNYTNISILYVIPTIFISSNIVLINRFIRK